MFSSHATLVLYSTYSLLTICEHYLLTDTWHVYLLGEPTEELIQELREDEAYILQKLKTKKNTSEESDEPLTGASEAVSRVMFVEKLCTMRSLSGPKEHGLPKRKGKKKQLAGALHAVEATHTDHHGHESRRTLHKGFINPAICQRR